MNNALKEQKKHGSPLYPLQIYHMASKQKPIFVACHWHQEIEILTVLEGKLELTVEGHKLTGTKGDIFMIGREKLHGMCTRDLNSRYNALVFPLELLNFETFDYCQCFYLNPLCKKELLFPLQIAQGNICHDDIWYELLYINKINLEKQLGYQMATKAALLKIISLLIQANLLQSRKNMLADADNAYQSQLKTVLSYVNTHYNQPLCLEDVAGVFGLSPKYFSRYFKKNFNQSFVLYLIYLRIEHAADYLLSTDMPVLEIASSVGFANFSYFIKKFKEIMGYTPTQFRKLKPTHGLYMESM